MSPGCFWLTVSCTTGPWRISRGMYTEEADFSVSNTAEENQSAQSAKSICLSPVLRRGPVLLQALTATPKPSPLLSMALVEALGSLVCEPGARNTDRHIFEKLLELCSSMGRPLFGLFDHPAREYYNIYDPNCKSLNSGWILLPLLIASQQLVNSSYNIQ